MQDGATAEVGMVGKRDVLGMNVLMGNSEVTQTEYVVQVAGSTIEIDWLNSMGQILKGKPFKWVTVSMWFI
jgi:hypothetical protein